MLVGPLASVALLLVAAGVAKLQTPAATATALGALGIADSRSRTAARMLGAVEVGLGAWALLGGSRWAAIALAVAYLLLAAVTLALLHRPQVPCGCFGSSDAPASVAGLVSNLAFATVAGLAAVWAPHSLLALAERPVEAASTLVLAVVGAWLVHEAHAVLPTLGAASRARRAA